jgi:hypothetical protein
MTTTQIKPTLSLTERIKKYKWIIAGVSILLVVALIIIIVIVTRPKKETSPQSSSTHNSILLYLTNADNSQVNTLTEDALTNNVAFFPNINGLSVKSVLLKTSQCVFIFYSDVEGMFGQVELIPAMNFAVNNKKVLTFSPKSLRVIKTSKPFNELDINVSIYEGPNYTGAVQTYPFFGQFSITTPIGSIKLPNCWPLEVQLKFGTNIINTITADTPKFLSTIPPINTIFINNLVDGKPFFTGEVHVDDLKYLR